MQSDLSPEADVPSIENRKLFILSDKRYFNTKFVATNNQIIFTLLLDLIYFFMRYT